jgi:hypothetical protein
MMSIVAIEAGAVDHAGDIAVELDVVEAVLRGFDFERIFFVEVAEFAELFMAEQAVVVEGHFCVERDQAAVAGHDAGVNLQQRSVGVHKSAVKRLEKGHRLRGKLARET